MLIFAKVTESGVGAAEVISALNTVIITLAGVIAIIIRNKDKKENTTGGCEGKLEPLVKALSYKVESLANLFTDDNSAFKRQLDKVFCDTESVREAIDLWMKSDENKEAKLKIIFAQISKDLASLKLMVEADANCDREIAKTVEAMWQIIKEFGN
jgi:hypothetical protein